MAKLCTCGNFKVCLITGRLDKPDLSVQSILGLNQSPRNIIKSLFRLRWRRQFVKITTSNVDHNKIQKISNVVQRKEALCSCNCITTVIIAHSFGAECVYEAMKALEFRDRAASREYRNRMALFTVGGNDFFRRHAAKVSLNFYFQNDFFTASMVNHYKRIHPRALHRSNIKELGPFWRASRRIQDFKCSCCTKERVVHVPRGHVDPGDTHNLCDYLRCETLKNNIMRSLSLI